MGGEFLYRRAAQLRLGLRTSLLPRILAIDYGTKRIGLAISDEAGRIAMPLEVLAGRNDPAADADAVAAVAAREEVAQVVVGLPLNMDDSVGPQARRTQQFIAELSKKCGLPVAAHDERLSSFSADELTRAAGLSWRKARKHRDKLAAQIILQGYLDRGSEPQQ